ncbi:YdcF family protein [Laspinema sp. D1]|uniref:YdcF family protein n=1 Tax=Laspinema palackyanum D2a TaxID=2953684 RepID=A0ABT2MSQ4_9CYAN|nr:YdcF family protein [Laspinema sp. D2a]
MSQRLSVGQKFLRLFLTTVLVMLVGWIPVQIAIARLFVPLPQAIVVLEGNPHRMTFAAQFWQQQPQLDIWLSGVGVDNPGYRQIFQNAGVPETQLYFEVRSTDTVKNFTDMREELVARGLRHVYLITSDYHIRRSWAIAFFVFGSRGMIITPIAVPSAGFTPESPRRVIRDCLRSILWIFTGYSGADLNPNLP